MKKSIALTVISVLLAVMTGCTAAVVNIPQNTPDSVIVIPTGNMTPMGTDTATPSEEPIPTLIPTLIPTNAAASPVAPTSSPGVNTTGKKLIALTFDDGPSSRATGRILDALEKNNAVATFFVVGKSDPPNDDSEKLKATKTALMTRAVNLGCEIGNHTMEHKHLPKLSASEITAQINGVNEIVRSMTGKEPVLVRPPYGDKSQLVYDTVKYPLILWSIDTLDWKTRDADSTYKSVIDNAKDGDIVLMHDLYTTTADAAERIIPKLIEKGFTLVTVSELFKQKGMELTPGSYYRCAY